MVKFALFVYRAPPLVAAVFVSKTEFVIVTIPERAAIAPPSSDEVLLVKVQPVTFTVPLLLKITPPPLLCVAEFPENIQLLKVAVAPPLLLK